MPLPVTFATLAGGNQPLSLFDTNFAAVGAIGVIPCSASGTNALTLTPFSNTPTISSYTDLAPSFVWVQPATTTGAVTINVAGIGSRNAYNNNGISAIGANTLIAGGTYKATFLAALNLGSGGFVVDVISGSQLLGTATSDNAAAGNVGEVISSTVAQGSAISLTSNLAANVTSITLTPGDWDVSAVLSVLGSGTTSVTYIESSISLVSAVPDQNPGRFAATFMNATVFPGFFVSPVGPGPTRFILGSTTTLFFTAKALFTVSTLLAWGIIEARRRR